jgi:hypothetical protein
MAEIEGRSADLGVIPGALWKAVPPQTDSLSAGWTVWTYGGIRVAWIGNLPNSQAIAEYLCRSHNEHVEGWCRPALPSEAPRSDKGREVDQ